jgi:hypothetical protein
VRLRRRQLGGFKFVHEQPIDRYYVDFIYRERRLIIERDGALCALGYRVIRIWSTEIIENLDGIPQTLLGEIEKNSPSPQPSPCKRGEGDNRCYPFLPEDAIADAHRIVGSELV